MEQRFWQETSYIRMLKAYAFDSTRSESSTQYLNDTIRFNVSSNGPVPGISQILP